MKLELMQAIAVVAAAMLWATAAPADELPAPAHQVLNGPEAVALAARTYAAFWNSGDPSYARAALAESFLDRTLPPGRPQGSTGPLAASAAFRTAVPDLRAEIEELIVSDDRAVSRLHFTGHFTGTFGAARGQGQPIDFRAIDVYRIENGRIAENWHLEDNLTLLRQLGVIPP
jgi:steroid delta-isomerase-like uncharacterized protein